MSKKATRHVRMTGTVKEMAASQIMMHIGSDRYNAIKAKDEHPQFIGMLVAYEGPSTGELERKQEDGLQQVKWWSDEAVYELAYRLNIDTPPLTLGHDNPDRRNEGMVLGGFIEHNSKMQNIPEAFGVAYVENEETKGKIASGELDVVSVEADVVMMVGQHGQVEIETVTKVDAVALGNSENNAPGFQRASIEAVVQEFERTQSKGTIHNEGSTGMNIDQMTTNQLLEHPAVDRLIRDQNKKTYEDFKTERDKADGLQTQLTAKETELAAAQAQLKDAGTALNKDKVATLASATLETAKINAEDKAAILLKVQQQATLFDPAAEGFDDQVKAFIDAEVTHMETIYKRMGIEVEGKGSDATDEGSGDGDDKGEKDGSGDTNKNTDPFLEANPVAAAV